MSIEKPVTQAQKKATAKWEKENYDKVLLRLKKGTKDRINALSDSVNGYIVQAVLDRLEQDEKNTDFLPFSNVTKKS